MHINETLICSARDIFDECTVRSIEMTSDYLGGFHKLVEIAMYYCLNSFKNFDVVSYESWVSNLNPDRQSQELMIKVIRSFVGCLQQDLFAKLNLRFNLNNIQFIEVNDAYYLHYPASLNSLSADTPLYANVKFHYYPA